jgi:hypothetical protein
MKIIRGLAINFPHLGRSAARAQGEVSAQHPERQARGWNTGFRVVFGGCPAPPFTVP